MTLPLDLEDWFTDVGDQVVRKQASQAEAALIARASPSSWPHRIDALPSCR